RLGLVPPISVSGNATLIALAVSRSSVCLDRYSARLRRSSAFPVPTHGPTDRLSVVPVDGPHFGKRFGHREAALRSGVYLNLRDVRLHSCPSLRTGSRNPDGCT